MVKLPPGIMRRISLLLFYVLFSLNFPAKAQISGFFLRNYNSAEYQIGNENWSVKEANNGIMYFANSKGVYNYDGVQWKLIKTPQAALSLGVDSATEKIFVGCRYGFGYIKRNEDGTEAYHSLSKDITEVEDVTDIFINGSEVVFFDNKNIYTADIHYLKITKIMRGSETRRFTGLIKHQNKLYVNIAGEGLRVISGQNFMNVQPDPLMLNAKLLFGIPFTQGTSLIGTENNQLLIFDGAKTTQFKVEAQAYIDDNLLASATDISATQICIATMAGGCLLINKQTGKTESMLNYRTGVPDDEIQAVEKDNEGGLWMTHSQGITRADLRVGFKTYGNYPGLEGYLISSLNHSGKLYVSTSEGVFYLDKVRTLQEAKTVIDHNYKEEFKKDIRHEDAPQKRRFFRNLFRKSEREQTTISKNTESGKKNKKTALQLPANQKYSTDFVFKKIKMINGKCRQLLLAGDKIIVASNTGLYEINGPDQVRILIKNEDINTAYLSADGNKIFAGTSKSLFCLNRNNEFWEPANPVSLKWGAYSLYEDKEKNLWIGGMGKALKLEFNSKGKPVQFKDYVLKDVYNEHILVSMIHNKIYFLVSSGAYFYSPNLDALLKDEALSKTYAHGNFISGNGKNTWAGTNSSWASLDPNSADKDIVLPLLALFKNIQNISSDAQGNLWLIVGDDEIYNIDKRDYNITASRFDLHLREITNDQGMYLTLKNLELDHNISSVNFYFAAPHYLDETSVEYQYLLKGAGEEWSAWVRNPHFKFPFLPSGNYDLMVRARNSLGQMSKIEVFSFRIHPPYWKTMWFYLAEISFFSLLIMLSIIMNRNKNNLFLSKALTFLTLIIIIEFIHQYISGVVNISASDNPMMRLGLDVLMALLISPIEKLLELIIMKRKRQMAQMVLYSRKQIRASKDWIQKIAKA
jgi:ligand-binding sensor domain-containing protein